MDASEYAQRTAIKRFLASSGRRVSDADVAAGSGVGIEATRRHLHLLMRDYECALDVREDGAIEYDFGVSLRRIGRPTLGERVRGFGRRLWRGFKWVYRRSLAALMVVYALAFLALIAFAAAQSARSGGSDENKGGARALGRVFGALLDLASVGDTVRDVDRRGYRHRRFAAKGPALGQVKDKPKKKGFAESVYDFVFGPPRVQIADGAQEREIAAFVRRHGGVLTTADIQALSGLSRTEASRRFAHFVARFEGETHVTEAGALVATFPTLLQSASTAGDDDVVYFWDEYEPPFELTGNTAGRNLMLVAMAAFNIIGGATVLGGAFANIPNAATWLGLVPVCLFAIYLVLPLLRAPFVYRQNRRQHITNIRKRVYREVFKARSDALAFHTLVARANSHRTTEEMLSAERLASRLKNIAYELGAHHDVTEDGTPYLALDVLEREHAGREEVTVEAPQPEVVFSTRDA